MCTVRSAHVVRHFEAFVEGEWLHVVSAYAKRGDLGSMLTRRAGEPLSEGMAWGLLGGMLRGLRDLHEHGLVHGELQPSNIFIGAARRAPVPGLRRAGSARSLRVR